MSGSTVAPPPPPADVGIIAALPIEIAPFLARLKHVRKYAGPRQTIIEGDCEGKLVVVLSAGVGRRAAGKGVDLLLAGHRPRWLISAGFAGALYSDLRRNDVLLASSVVVDGEPGAVLAIDLVLNDEDGAATARAGRRIVSGRLLTVDRIIRTAQEKAELGAAFQARGVDMESFAVAATCAERGVRFLGVRVISDEADTDLPPEVLSILGPTGSFRLGAAVGAVWKRPSSVKELWQLREHAYEASERLGEVLPELIARLP